MADVPVELFTWSSLGTFTGLTGATVVVTNALARAIRWNPAWFGLAVAGVLSVGLTAFASQSAASAGAAFGEYVLALLNACLVYVSAAGTSSIGAAATTGGAGGSDALAGPAGQEGFFKRWV
jgi:hypothetical protein